MTEEQRQRKNEQRRQWRLNNPDKVAAQRKRYKAARTPEQRAKDAAHKAAWQKAHPERNRLHNKRWRHANPDKVKEKDDLRTEQLEARFVPWSVAPWLVNDIAVQLARRNNNVQARIKAVVRKLVRTPQLREDMESDVVLGLLEGRVAVDQIPQFAQVVARRHFEYAMPLVMLDDERMLEWSR